MISGARPFLLLLQLQDAAVGPRSMAAAAAAAGHTLHALYSSSSRTVAQAVSSRSVEAVARVCAPGRPCFSSLSHSLSSRGESRWFHRENALRDPETGRRGSDLPGRRIHAFTSGYSTYRQLQINSSNRPDGVRGFQRKKGRGSNPKGSNGGRKVEAEERRRVDGRVGQTTGKSQDTANSGGYETPWEVNPGKELAKEDVEWLMYGVRPGKKASSVSLGLDATKDDENDDDGEDLVLESSFLDAVVKVYCTHTQPNFSLPWQKRRQFSSTGSGFVIAGRRLLTNAHCVEHHTQVRCTRFCQWRERINESVNIYRCL